MNNNINTVLYKELGAKRLNSEKFRYLGQRGYYNPD